MTESCFITLTTLFLLFEPHFTQTQKLCSYPEQQGNKGKILYSNFKGFFLSFVFFLEENKLLKEPLKRYLCDKYVLTSIMLQLGLCVAGFNLYLKQYVISIDHYITLTTIQCMTFSQGKRGYPVQELVM